MDPDSSVLKYFLEKWRVATDKGDHETALLYAIMAYLITKEIEQGIESVFLLKAELSAVALQNKSTEDVMRRIREEATCSFCGKNADETQLIAGGGANICKRCATELCDRFSKPI